MAGRAYVEAITYLLCGVFLLTGCGADSGPSGAHRFRIVTVGGSTALQPLAEEVAAQYEQKTGNVVSVQGGGSGTGLSQVANGTFDIGLSDIFAEEKAGLERISLTDHKVAVIGMAPIVNPSVHVRSISPQQLVDVFTGKITNWKQVGGVDQKIIVINRAKGSGTRAAFEKYGLGGATVVEAQEQDSSGTVRQVVAQTPGAISYLAFPYITTDVVALHLDGIPPTEESVALGKWPIWSYEHMYTKGQPGPDEQAFLDYLLSESVQNTLVRQLGYIPINAMKVDRPFHK